jgi:hypothetical protein
VLIEGLLVAIVVAFGAMFLLGGLLVLRGVAGHLAERWGAFFAALASERWVTTMGKLERAAVTYTTSRGGRTYTPFIRYSYDIGGRTLLSERFAFEVTSGPGEEGLAAARAVVQRLAAGGAVQVFYDPDKPQRATLDRRVPSVVGATFGWSFVLLLGAGLAFMGVKLVLGPFEDPPNLGEVPPLLAQFGGLATAAGVFCALVSGARAVGKQEREQRRLLRQIEAARASLLREVREGERVAVSGRVESPGSDPELPFEDGPLVYYDVDIEFFRRTCYSDFWVRDASGVASVELRENESTFVQKRRIRIEGAVERWLDEQRDSPDDPIAAYPEWLGFRRIRVGDSVLLVGRAERDGDELVFRGSSNDPATLLVADGSREEVLGRLSKRLGRTRALLLIGGGLVVAGIVAMVA